uniref:Uncharacterized protein n=1 Tax=Anguilla anguilla TaxID=7936 RepID=A0A0E9T657_ANGAN
MILNHLLNPSPKPHRAKTPNKNP